MTDISTTTTNHPTTARNPEALDGLDVILDAIPEPCVPEGSGL